MSYQEFPKVLSHPQHKAAVIGQGPREKPEVYAERAAREGPPQPERWPAVTVTNIDQEEEYVAKGYLSPGRPTPAGPVGVVEYPKWVFHREEAPVIVKDAAQQEALGPGWYDTPACEDTPEPAAAAAKPKRGKK
jgi:hypothetical protein